MFKQCLSAVAVLLVAAAALMLSPGNVLAQHRGGGGHGGHGGGFHGGGFHGGGVRGGSWHGGGWHGGGWHGGGWHGHHHRGFYGYYPYWGWGDPWYYGGYASYNYWPNYYAYTPTYDYYSTPYYYGSAPDYGTYSQPSSNYTYGAQATPATDNTAVITVVVPADAQVWFGNSATSQTGTVRNFQSPPLNPGRRYVYEVRAKWREDGQEVTKARQVDVWAGARVTVDFTQPAASTAGASD
jgi:uncharacterized protein (TIGR03000 family)